MCKSAYLSGCRKGGASSPAVTLTHRFAVPPLPLGWKYQVRNLDSNLEMKTGGKAYVVQDDLKDTYQRLN